MGANTPHLNLYLPSGGSSGNPAGDENYDVDHDNNNMRAIDTWATGVDTLIGTDTGWVALASPGSAVTLTGAVGRVKSGILYLDGSATKTSNWAAADTAVVLPVALRSLLARNNIHIGAWYGNGTGTLLVINQTNGQAVISGLSGTSSPTMYFGSAAPIN